MPSMASSTDTTSANDVPFFLTPDLGGSHMLRGYPVWRFRDRNRVLFTGEYRWTAGPFLDMSAFVDAGNVAPRFSDLNLGNLKTSHGLGLTIDTPSSTIARVEFARTREGSSLLLSISPSF